MRPRRIVNAKILLLLLFVLSSLPFASAKAVYNPDFVLPRGEYKYGGDLRISRNTVFPTLNPFSGTGASWYYSTLVYEGLVTMGPDWNPEPWLARSWKISKDAKTYTFYLWENATWSDDVPLTSEDVKFTFEGWKEHEMPRMLPYIKNIDNIETPDEYTVIFHLNETDTTFIPRLIMWPALCIVPKHIWENIEDWNKFEVGDPELSIGSGPFKFDEWKKGEYVRVVANENYWMGRPYLDSITFIIIQMRDMQIMAFEKGELDIFRGLQGNEVGKFLGKPEFLIYQNVDVGVSNLVANMRRRPGNDTAFRHALAYCVDYDKIIDLAYYGYGAPVRHFLTPPPYDDAGWVPPETAVKDLNTTKAAEILDEAGYLDVNGDGWREYPDGSTMKLKMSEPDYERYIRIAEIIMDPLTSIGVNIESEVLDWGLWSVKTIQAPDYDLTYFRYGPASGDPREPLGYLVSWGENWYGFYNETFDELYSESLKIVEPDELRPVIWELQRVLAEQMPYIPIPNAINLHVVNVEKLAGWSNPIPYGPCVNGQHWFYYNLHLPGPPASISTMLDIDVAESATENNPVSIAARLVDEEGNSIEGKYIDFNIAGISVGALQTSSGGTATFTWVPTEEGSFEIKITFAGDPEFAKSESEAKTVIVGAVAPPPPPPPPNYTPYYVAAGIVIIVLVIAGVLISRARKI